MSPSPQGVIAVAVVLPTFATFAVVARIWARRAKKISIKSDDWTIILGLVCVQIRAKQYRQFLTFSYSVGSRLGSRNPANCW